MMSNKKLTQKFTHINISTYQEVFSIINILSKEYIFPNMPKKYIFKHLFRHIEIGHMYKKGDVFIQTLYFVPNESPDYSFCSTDMIMNTVPVKLEEILDYLDTPYQILSRFYLLLMKFSKGRKKKMNGLRLSLHFIKVVLENEKKYMT